MTILEKAADFVERYPLMTRSLLLIVILGLNVAGVVRWYQKRSPGVPLDLAIEAIRKHDSASFSEAVDVDRLVASYYDQHLQEGRPVTEATRALYVKNISRRLRHWIDSGVTETSSPRFDALVGFVRESADSRRWRIHDVDLSTSSGAVTLHNNANDRVDMKLKIVKEGGRWRVAELLNVADVVDEVRNAEWRRLGPPLRTINEAVAIVPSASVDSVIENNSITTYREKVQVKKGQIEWAACDLFSAGGSFVRTIAVVTTPLRAGQEATFAFQWRDCGAVTDCLPIVRWAQVSVNGKMLSVRPRPLD